MDELKNGLAADRLSCHRFKTNSRLICSTRRSASYATMPSSRINALVANLPLGKRSRFRAVFNSEWNCSLVP